MSDASLCSSLRSLAWLAFTATASANPLPVAGIYQVWGNDSGATASYVRGGQIALDWATIEPQRKTFNWSSLDSELKYYASIGKVATVQVNSTTKPAWVWNVVARCGSVQGQAAPQYWDPAYMTVQTELVSALAAHLKSSPYESTVALVRSAPTRSAPSRPTCRPGTRARPRPPATRSRRSGRRTCATPTTTTS